MKRTLLLCALLLAFASPSWAVSKEIVQLQQSVQLLSDQIRDLTRLVTERLAVMSQLVEKASDSTNRMQGSIDNVQRSLQTAMSSQASSANQKMDSQASHLQAVADSVEDLKVRQTRLGEQIASLKTLLETIQAPPAPVPAAQPAVAPPPPAPALYDSALRDLYGGKADTAMTEFQDYLKFYPTGERAENAQYYIGEIFFNNQQFDKAIDSYTSVIDNYPKGNKTASAHLKKGFALIELKQKDAGVRELRTLIKRFPTSEEAKRAQERLKSMGLTASGAAGPARSPRRR